MKPSYLKALIIVSPWLFSKCTSSDHDSQKTRPNILIAMGDDISFPHMSECMKNLAIDAGYNSVLRKLREELYLELLQQDDPRVYNNDDIFDQYPYADNSLKDFYNKFMKSELKKEDAGWVDTTDFENIK